MTRTRAKTTTKIKTTAAITIAGIMSTITGKANQMQRVTCPGEQHFESVTIIAGAKKKLINYGSRKKN